MPAGGGDPDQVANIFTDPDMTPTAPDTFAPTDWRSRPDERAWGQPATAPVPIIVTAAVPPAKSSKLAVMAVVLLGALVVVLSALAVVLSKRSSPPASTSASASQTPSAAANTTTTSTTIVTTSPSSRPGNPLVTVRVAPEVNRYRDATSGFCLDMPTWSIADPTQQYDPLASETASASDVAAFRSSDGDTQLVFAIEPAPRQATYDKWTALTVEPGPTPPYRLQNDKNGGWVTSSYNGGKVVYVEGQYVEALRRTVTFRYVFPPSKQSEMESVVQRTLDGFNRC